MIVSVVNPLAGQFAEDASWTVASTRVARGDQDWFDGSLARKTLGLGNSISWKGFILTHETAQQFLYNHHFSIFCEVCPTWTCTCTSLVVHICHVMSCVRCRCLNVFSHTYLSTPHSLSCWYRHPSILRSNWGHVFPEPRCESGSRTTRTRAPVRSEEEGAKCLGLGVVGLWSGTIKPIERHCDS